MSTTITHADGAIVPAVVNGFESARPARTLVHTILGRPDPDITYRPAGLRKGELLLVFESGAESAAAEAILVSAQVFTLSDPDVPQVAMPFVVANGEVSSALDLDTQTVWVLRVPFQEVAS